MQGFIKKKFKQKNLSHLKTLVLLFAEITFRFIFSKFKYFSNFISFKIHARFY